MKINISFRWYDFWIGFYYDTKKKILYVCPLPMIVLEFQKKDKLVKGNVELKKVKLKKGHVLQTLHEQFRKGE